MSATPAVLVERVGKRFTIRHQRPSGLKEHLLGQLRGERSAEEHFWALEDVSLAVARGEMLGLIGANGSGKSTLLQVIAGIYAPDTGSVRVTGRLRALLELGTGFNPELTGRENVFLNAALLGFGRADLRRRFDAIVGFAELERFIDMPLKTYSSGMQVRLAFATAIHLDPEVLLLDEVLAVGDDHFQRKCLRRVREIRQAGAAILFISHDLVTVEQLCDRVCLLASGRLAAEGRAADVISRYRASLAGERSITSPGRRWGTREVVIESVAVTGAEGATARAFRTGEPLAVRIGLAAPALVTRPVVGLAIRKADGTLVSGPNTKMGRFPIDRLDGRAELEYRITSLPLLPGAYTVAAAVYDEALLTAYDHWEDCASFLVLEDGTAERFGVVAFDAEWSLRHERGERRPAETRAINTGRGPSG